MTFTQKMFCLCIGIFVIIPSNILSAQDTQNVTSSSDLRRQLLAGKQLKRYFRTGGLPSLIPEINYKNDILSNFRSLNPTIGAEILLLGPSVPESQTPSNQQMLDALTDIATLSGLSYYSPDKKQQQTFFNNVFPVDGPTDEKPVQATAYDVGNGETSFYARFDDDTLGYYNCEMKYRHRGGSVSIEMINTTTIRLGIFPVARPGRAHSFYLLMPYEDRYLFYGVTSVKTINLFGLAESKKAEFFYKTKAVYKWMMEQMNAIGIK
jgi:hypothetical protein